MKKLSIIVPVYNVEEYLDECLNSLVNQSLDDYEVICVNDGTKDNSQAIIDKFVENYPDKVKGVIKENGGLSDARNYGLKYAEGEYITFLDSDDFAEDIYKEMYETAKKDDLDLVVADLEYFFEDNSTLYKEGLNTQVEDKKKAIFLSPMFAWNKMYRFSLFKELNLAYPLGLWYEDIPVTTLFAANCQKIGYVNKLGYHYRQRKSSIMGSGYDKRMYHIFDILQLVHDNFEKYSLLDKYNDELEYLFTEQLMLYGAFRFLRTEEYKDLMNTAYKFIMKYYPNFRKNKYLKQLGIKNRFFVQTISDKTAGLWHLYFK